MTVVALGRMIGTLSYVRERLLSSYRVDQKTLVDFRDSTREMDWAVPLMRTRPEDPISEKPCGAFRFFLSHGDEHNVWERGTGNAWLQLLPRMPKSLEDLGLGGDIKPLAEIGAGKSTSGTCRSAFVGVYLNRDVPWAHYLHLLPVALDMLNRFSRQIAADLPKDIEWREDLSHLSRAA